MFLFLVFKVTLVLLPVLVFSAYLQNLGIQDWLSSIISGLVGWWLLSKYDEILIDVVDYTREKDDQSST